MPFYLEMSKNITQQGDIYDTVIFRFLQIFYGLKMTIHFYFPIKFKYITRRQLTELENIADQYNIAEMLLKVNKWKSSNCIATLFQYVSIEKHN